MFPLLKSCNFGSSDCKILQSNLHCDKTIFTPLQLNGQLKCKIIFRCVIIRSKPLKSEQNTVHKIQSHLDHGNKTLPPTV